jgi:hypothetical protein
VFCTHKQKLDAVGCGRMACIPLACSGASLSKAAAFSLSHSWHISNENFAPAREVGCVREQRVRGGCIRIERRRKSFRCGSFGQASGRARTVLASAYRPAPQESRRSAARAAAAAPTSSQLRVSDTRARAWFVTRCRTHEPSGRPMGSR